jgi:hypothetical protein
MSDDARPTPGRRGLITGAGALGLGALLAGKAAAATPQQRRAIMPPGQFDPDFLPDFTTPTTGAGSCTLTPTATAGPFYIDTGLVRKDITEGKPGLPLALFIRVIDAATCQPIPGAVVDAWQCDAGGGLYSGVAGLGTAGETFLRGIQYTNLNGVASFLTIYPGWYPGRTTHIHLKVNPDTQSELTTQLYFPDVVNGVINDMLPPYDTHGFNSTNNGNDFGFTVDTVLNLGIIGPPLGLYGWVIIAVNQ